MQQRIPTSKPPKTRRQNAYTHTHTLNYETTHSNKETTKKSTTKHVHTHTHVTLCNNTFYKPNNQRLDDKRHTHTQTFHYKTTHSTNQTTKDSTTKHIHTHTSRKLSMADAQAIMDGVPQRRPRLVTWQVRIQKAFPPSSRKGRSGFAAAPSARWFWLVF